MAKVMFTCDVESPSYVPQTGDIICVNGEDYRRFVFIGGEKIRYASINMATGMQAMRGKTVQEILDFYLLQYDDIVAIRCNDAEIVIDGKGRRLK